MQTSKIGLIDEKHCLKNTGRFIDSCQNIIINKGHLHMNVYELLNIKC